MSSDGSSFVGFVKFATIAATDTCLGVPSSLYTPGCNQI